MLVYDSHRLREIEALAVSSNAETRELSECARQVREKIARLRADQERQRAERRRTQLSRRLAAEFEERMASVDAEISEMEAEAAALDTANRAASERWQVFGELHTACKTFVTDSGARPASTPKVKSPKQHKTVDAALKAIERLRSRLSVLRNDLRTAEQAPLPRDAVVAKVKGWIEQQAASWEPHLAPFVQPDTAPGAVRLVLPTQHAGAPEQLVAMLCAIVPEQVEAEITRRATEQASSAGPTMDPDGRRKRIEELTEEIAEVERAEAEAVAAAREQRASVLWRSDTDPAALLRARQDTSQLVRREEPTTFQQGATA